MFGIVLAAVVAFVVYALVTQYQATDPAKSVPQRVWQAVKVAAVAIAAGVAGWLSGLGNG